MAHRLLLDTGFLYALYQQDDFRHRDAQRAIQRYARSPLLVLQVVLAETAMFIQRRGGQYALRQFVPAFTAAQYTVIETTNDDLTRVAAIVDKCHDNSFDFVDCCLMAAAERLDITRICTFDRRDFGVFRPHHAERLELLP